MVNSVVIGGNGFIGSHLVDALANQGHSVTAFDRFSSGSRQFVSKNVRVMSGDFLNISDLKSAVEGQDNVFHFLSTTTPMTAENDPTMDIRTNVAQTIELLDLASAAKVSQLYFGSTGGAIYGPQGLSRYSETDRTLPISPYGIGKLTIERYLAYFREKKGLNSTVLRVSNPYGTRQKIQAKQGFIPIALRKLKQGEPIVRFGNGTMIRDFVFINDAVDMIIQIVSKDNLHNLYNIGSGVGVSVNQVIHVIEKVTKSQVSIDELPAPPTFIDSVVLDTHRYTEEFGPFPLTSLEEGIRLTLQESF